MSETKLRLRGFTKVQIVDSDSGTVVGDSGWVQNKITKVGFHNMAVRGAAGVSGAEYIPAKGLGLGYFDNVNFNSLKADFDAAPEAIPEGAGPNRGNGRIMTGDVNCNSILATVANGAILRFAATWPASANFIVADTIINGIGIFNNTATLQSADANKMLAGTTFAESAWSQDQEVRATYELKFSQ